MGCFRLVLQGCGHPILKFGKGVAVTGGNRVQGEVEGAGNLIESKVRPYFQGKDFLLLGGQTIDCLQKGPVALVTLQFSFEG